MTPLVVGQEDSAQYAFFGDEDGLLANVPNKPFHRGERLELVPSRCDPTVDHYDFIWLVQGVGVVARGCSQ